MPGTAIRDLRELARKLHTSTPTTIHPDDATCYVCHRVYGSQDDDTEPPCQAVQLHPCGHLIGASCLASLPTAFRSTCQRCTLPLEDLTPVPSWLFRLLWTSDLGILLPGELIPRASTYLGESATASLAAGVDRVFRGTCSTAELVHIWGLYVSSAFIHCAVIFTTYVAIPRAQYLLDALLLSLASDASLHMSVRWALYVLGFLLGRGGWRAWFTNIGWTLSLLHRLEFFELAAERHDMAATVTLVLALNAFRLFAACVSWRVVAAYLACYFLVHAALTRWLLKRSV